MALQTIILLPRHATSTVRCEPNRPTYQNTAHSSGKRLAHHIHQACCENLGRSAAVLPKPTFAAQQSAEKNLPSIVVQNHCPVFVPLTHNFLHLTPLFSPDQSSIASLFAPTKHKTSALLHFTSLLPPPCAAARPHTFLLSLHPELARYRIQHVVT